MGVSKRRNWKAIKIRKLELSASERVCCGEKAGAT